MAVSELVGHLSSRSVSQSGHGSEHCPWVISVQPGKTVDLYVVDFSLSARYQDLMAAANNGDDRYCHVYATVRELPLQGQAEGEGHDEVKICAGNRREQLVYSSVSNQLSVRLSPLVFDDPTANFLLKYVGPCTRQFRLRDAANLHRPTVELRRIGRREWAVIHRWMIRFKLN